jgi:hypothetical protein
MLLLVDRLHHFIFEERMLWPGIWLPYKHRCGAQMTIAMLRMG